MNLRPLIVLLSVALAACVTHKPPADPVATRYHFDWSIPPSSPVAAVFDDGIRTYVTLHADGGQPVFVNDAGQALTVRHVPPYYVIEGVRPGFWIRQNASRSHITLVRPAATAASSGGAKSP
jgi:hypothetical protein